MNADDADKNEYIYVFPIRVYLRSSAVKFSFPSLRLCVSAVN